jgi:hypothetical protein
MLRFIIPIASVAALAASGVPAMAQSWGNQWGNSLEARKANIDRRIEMGQRNGALTYAEAARLRAQFRQINRLEVTYRRNGLSGWEHTDLMQRLDRLSAAIRFERRDRDYSSRYGDSYYGGAYGSGYAGYRY